MVEDHKKTESEGESNEMVLIHTNHRRIVELERRILAVEKILMSFTYNSEMGSGHPDDGGWFD